MTVVAATVGAVFALGAQEGVEVPAPRPQPDAAAPSVSALQPVIPAPRDGRPARIDPVQIAAVPAGVTGRAIAGAHAIGSAPVRALDVLRASGFPAP
jgi:hypothetical protein